MNIYYYIIFYIVIFILSLFAIRVEDKKRKWLFVIICISFFIFYGFRDASIGYDTKTYIRYYNSKDAHSYISQEKIFYYIALIFWTMKIPTSIYISFLTLLVILMSALAYYLIFKLDNKYLCLAYFCMFCLPYSIMMNVNVVRQGIVISALLLSAVLLDLNHKKIAIVIAIIGCLFHYMGIIILAGMAILSVAKEKKYAYRLTIAGCVAGVVADIMGVGRKFLELFPQNQLTKRVLSYLRVQTTRTDIIKIVFYLLIALIVVHVLMKYKTSIGYIDKLIFSIMMMAGIWTSCMTVATRIIISMDMIIPISLLNPKIVRQIEAKNGIQIKKIYIKVIIGACIIMYVYGLFFNPVKANLGF